MHAQVAVPGVQLAQVANQRAQYHAGLLGHVGAGDTGIHARVVLQAVMQAAAYRDQAHGGLPVRSQGLRQRVDQGLVEITAETAFGTEQQPHKAQSG